jgi:hypothetical protein
MQKYHQWVEKKPHQPHQQPVLSWLFFALTLFVVIGASFYRDDEGITVHSTSCLKTKRFLIFLSPALSWSCFDLQNKFWRSIACKVSWFVPCRYFFWRHLKRNSRRAAEHQRKLVAMTRWVMGYWHSTSTLMYARSGSHLGYTTLRANNMHALKSIAFCLKLEKENAIFQLLVFWQSISLSHPVLVRDVQFTRIANNMD